MTKQKNAHAFSIELNSKRNLGLDLPKEVDDQVLIEGTLGEILSLRFVEGEMLELKGSISILRMDISEAEWNTLIQKEVVK